MMLSAGLPELRSLDDIGYLRKTLVLSLSEKDALEDFKKKFDYAIKNSFSTSMNWFAHNVKRDNPWKVSSKSCSGLLHFLPECLQYLFGVDQEDGGLKDRDIKAHWPTVVGQKARENSRPLAFAWSWLAGEDSLLIDWVNTERKHLKKKLQAGNFPAIYWLTCQANIAGLPWLAF